MKVVVVSQYYPPEPGATQNRLGSFVDGLVERGHEITVICEQPNHPTGIFHSGFGRRPVVTERLPGRTVHRLWVAASPRKTSVRRLAFYASFAAGCGAAVLGGERHDVALFSSPPLPGVLSAAIAARMRGIPYVLDVRDIWPAAAEALGELSNRRVIEVFESFERMLYRNAARVTATTAPFCRHIDAVAGRRISTHLPNGALDELLSVEVSAGFSEGPFTVGYAGNLGIAQGLDIAVDAATLLRDEDVRLVLIGDGPVRELLEHARVERGLTRLELLPPVPVAEIGAFLRSCDALLVPLRDHDLLEQFIPSKLYDAMAVGKPAIVAARGEAAKVVQDHECGLVVPPEDGEALAAAIMRLRDDPGLASDLGKAGRSAAPQHVRSRQIKRLESILTEAATSR